MLDYMFLFTERQSYVNPPTKKKKIKYISCEDIGQEQQKENKKKYQVYKSYLNVRMFQII